MKLQEFVKNTLKYSIPTMVSVIIGLTVIPVITRIYPTEEYGKISLFFTIGSTIASVFTLDLSGACMRFFYEPLNGASRQSTFNFAFITGLAITSVFALSAYFFFRETVTKYLFGEDNLFSLLLFCIYIISTIAYKLQSNYARLSHQMAQFNLIQVSYVIINKVLFIIAVLYSVNYFYSILVITIALFIEVSTLGSKTLSFTLELPDNPAKKKLLLFSLPALPASLGLFVNNTLAKIMLSAHGDFKAVGTISMAINIANSFNIISTVFNTYWDTFMYENYVKEHELIKRIHSLIEFLSIVMLSAIFSFQDLLYTIMGSNYRGSQSYFLLIILMPIQILLCATTSYGISLTNKTYFHIIISFIACVVNVSISYLLYPYIGAKAMALGIGTSAIVQMLLKTVIGQKLYKSIESIWQTFSGIVIICFVCFINLLLYDKFYGRLAVSVFAIFTASLIYRKETLSIIAYLHNALSKYRN